jgi:peroxiredoxin
MTSPIPTSLPSQGRTGLKPRILSHGLLLLFIVGLCVANLLLIKQNRELKAAIAGNQPEFLKPGDHVRSFAADTLSGERQMVNYTASAKTVLLVFRSECPACERTLPYWKEIKAACDRQGYQIFGISLDSSAKTSEFLKTKGFNLEVFAGPDAQFKDTFKLNLTPLTIVIGNDGKVERVWPGAFNENSKTEVETYFGISPDEK